MIFVDTNVLLDLVTDDPNWAEWSIARLEEAALAGPIVINDVVYAETSIRYQRIEDLDTMLITAQIEIVPIPRTALFLAGKVFLKYRSNGGTRTSVLPDFFIGAHAAVAGSPLITRDPSRYRTYFPGLELIAPESSQTPTGATPLQNNPLILPMAVKALEAAMKHRNLIS